MIAQTTEISRQVKIVVMLLERHAKTEEPYRNILRAAEFPTIPAAPMISMPVPRKNERAIDMPNFRLNNTLRNV